MIDAQGHRDHYRSLLRERGYSGTTAPFARAPGLTTARTQVDVLLGVADAADVLAILASYLELAGIETVAADWSMSCLPRYARSGSLQRAATVSLSSRETLFVWLDRRTGKITEWGMLLAEPDGNQPVAIGSGLTLSSHRHGCFVHGTDFDSWVVALRTTDLVDAARSVVRARRARGTTRRHSWHNSYLVELLRPRAGRDDGTAMDTGWNVTPGYSRREVAQRRHQAAFRDRLLAHSDPPECAVCGLDRIQVLDAAHLVADARGGPSNSDNALLLCANHHRAMDAGLFRWVAGEARWRRDIEPF